MSLTVIRCEIPLTNHFFCRPEIFPEAYKSSKNLDCGNLLFSTI